MPDKQRQELTVAAKGSQMKFDTPVILLGGGWVDASSFGEFLNHGYPVIAADGGANHLDPLNITPDAIVGDMDSIEDVDYWRAKTRFLEQAEQETTDFEKAIRSCRAEIKYCFGFMGKRLDHTLAAMHVLAKYNTENIVLVGQYDVVIAVRGKVEFSVSKGDRVSIVPLSRTVFGSSVGLKYPLDGLEMEHGVQTGTSNEASDAKVTIKSVSGTYAILLEPENLSALTNARTGS